MKVFRLTLISIYSLFFFLLTLLLVLGIVLSIYLFSGYHIDYNTNEFGKYNKISDFGEEEYKCTGFCYCEQSDIESRKLASAQTAKLFSRGVIYLVTAVSSVVAFDRAKSYFSDKCQEELRETCPPDSIQSVVDDCLFTTQMNTKSIVDDNAISSTKEKVKKTKNGRLQWSCEGYCFPNQKYSPEVKKAQNLFTFGPKSGKFWNIIKGIIPVMRIFQCRDLKLKKIVGGRTEEEAVNNFLTDDLVSFCMKTGGDIEIERKDGTFVHYNKCNAYLYLQRLKKNVSVGSNCDCELIE